MFHQKKKTMLPLREEVFLRSSCEKQKEQKKENFQILRKLKEKDVVVTSLFDF